MTPRVVPKEVPSGAVSPGDEPAQGAAVADVNDLIPDIITQAAEPASTTSDGQSATGRPLGELLDADARIKNAGALAGTNANGGPRSGWGCLRTARAVPGGGPY